jgi:hypothetical protein
MSTIVMLALLGAAEAVVWMWRMRTAASAASRWHAAAWTLATCVLRVAFIALGVSATLAGDWLVAGAAYCLAASGTTWLVHPWGWGRRKS